MTMRPHASRHHGSALTLAVVLAATAAALHGQPAAVPGPAVDKVFAAWSDATPGCAVGVSVGGKVTMLSDGNAEFTRALGLDFDGSAVGLGTRSKRYAMVVEDGVVKSLMVEDVPTQAEKSSASALLAAL